MNKQQDESIVLSLDSIHPYENNPRDNDASVPFVAKSMEDFGYNSKIEVTEDHVILVGHTRLKALKYLQTQGKLGKGMLKDVTEDSVPVIVKHGLKTEAQQKEYRLADNKASENSGWDFPKLDMELAEIKELDPVVDMEAYGFISNKFDEPPIEDVSDPSKIEIEVPVEEDDKEIYVVNVFLNDSAKAYELLDRLKEEGYNCKMN